MSNYYVHYNLHNYVKYGINKTGSATEDEAKTLGQLQGYLNRHRAIVNTYKQKAKQNNGRIQQMEEFYKKLLDSSNTNDKRINAIRDSYLKQVNQIVENTCKQRAGTIERDNLLHSIVIDDSDSIDQKYRQALKQVLDESVNSLVETTHKKSKLLKDTIKKLQLVINQTKQDNSFKDLMEAQIKQFQIEKSISEISNDLSSMLEILEKSKRKIFDLKQDEKIFPFAYLQKLIHVLGKLPSFGNESYQQGIVGEVFSATYQYVAMDDMSQIAASTILSQDWLNKTGLTFTGSKKIKAEYNSPLTLAIKKEGIEARVRKINTSGAHVSKTDVLITVPDGSVIPMSVKNYKSLKGNLTLVDGTSLGTLLHSLDVTDEFTGHYANLIAKHNPETLSQSSGFNINKYKNIVNQIIMQQALINGFKGYNNKRAPKIFVVFDSKRNDVRVYDIEVLIGRMLQKNSFIIEGIPSLGNLKSITQLSINGSNGQELTNNAATLFQQHKLHVAIKLLG